MELRHELSYDAPPAAVLTMLLDPGYWDAVAVATGAISSSTTVQVDGDATTVVVDQLQSVAVPSFARKFVGSSTRAIKTQVWHGSTATFEVEAPGKPMHVRGSAILTGDGSGSVLTYELELKARVPLVGGKLEKLMGEVITGAFVTEQQTGAGWLSDAR